MRISDWRSDVCSSDLQGIALDAEVTSLARQLDALEVDTVIHTAGPFQQQDYRVAQACIDARCNYLDLADGRDFVAGIGKLDAAAHLAGVLEIGSASCRDRVCQYG